jgi:tRNA(fMet)-specific endonuclease VapC
MYLLDTSVCVHILRGDAPSIARLATLGPDDIALSAMTVAELRFGAMKGKTTKQALIKLESFLSVFPILAFDASAAELHAMSRVSLTNAGTPIGERDLVIASIALAHELILATGNVRELKRIPTLKVEAWT